jgi:hypothetical protein
MLTALIVALSVTTAAVGDTDSSEPAQLAKDIGLLGQWAVDCSDIQANSLVFAIDGSGQLTKSFASGVYSNHYVVSALKRLDNGDLSEHMIWTANGSEFDSIDHFDGSHVKTLRSFNLTTNKLQVDNGHVLITGKDNPVFQRCSS